jgi:hypothetical protein
VNVLLGVLVVAAFAGIVERARLPAQARDAVERARASYAVVSDRSLTDDQKERRLREEAPRLVALLGRIVFGSLLALALPLGVLWALDWIGLISLPDVLDVLVRVDFLLVVSALGILAFWNARRRRSKSSHTVR